MDKISVILPVKIGDEWQQELAEFAISTMRAKTRRKFELIVVESDSKEMKDFCDVHIKRLPSTYTEDFNAAQELASGDFIVHTAIDIIVGDQWLEALIEPFEQFKDCGVTTVSVTEPGSIVGEKLPSRKIIEGMYGPLMMFRKEWKLDPAFPNLHSDSDLVMRMYEAGLRSYRNHRSVAYHLDGITWKSVTTASEREEQRKKANMLFQTRYANSPLWMAKMILRGGVLYGREHEQ